jgi:hypothetical protein
MKHKSNKDHEKQLQILSNELTRANTHFYFAKNLHDNRNQLVWAKDFWDYTLTAHCSIALLNLCRVYDYHKDGLNLFNCLQSIDKHILDRNAQTQLSVYIAESGPKSQNPFVKSLRKWRHEIIAHYNYEAALDREQFDNDNPIEPEEIIQNLIEKGFQILEWCGAIQGTAAIYKKFALGKEDCEQILKRLI